MSAQSQLRTLANLISAAVDTIDSHFAKHNADYPDLNVPHQSESRSETLARDADIVPATMTILGACAHLSALVNIPGQSLYGARAAFLLSAALRTAVEGNVAEILRDRPEGAYCKDIALANGMHPGRLSRTLRCLAAHHIFLEVAPDTFKNNRLSSLMDTGKPITLIESDPVNKHTRTSGIAASIEHTTDEVFKAAAFMPETLLDKTAGHSDDFRHAPFVRAFGTEQHFFEWLELAGNEHRLKRFAAAMEGTVRLDPPNALVSGFNWGNLSDGSTVVDVGGGKGHVVLRILEDYPSLKYIIQDRPSVISEAVQFWKQKAPGVIDSGNVDLQIHDFYEEQPIKGADIYMLRLIIHDYGDSYATKILSRLREAASSKSRLLIIERVLPYACPTESVHKLTGGIKGAIEPLTPAPLLPNHGIAAPYLFDMQMLSMLYGEERTLGGFADLLSKTGWAISETSWQLELDA